ncbi:hypothetical protein [Aestuariivivens insulae]|uniref:hypothetical protein n=1 Tax=Aestuariivivens insulae TaxID=1621988 RepID=UPI001F57C563|nr:hypothetical protein [Aestuariivivens insulae]
MFKHNFIAAFCLCSLSIFHGQSIFTNDITGTNPNQDNPFTTGQTYDSNITVSGISRGPGITGVNTNDRYNAEDWGLLFNSNDYFEFTLTPNDCYEIDFVSLVFNGQSSLLGPDVIEVRSSIDSYATYIGSTISLPLGVETESTIDLTSSEFQNISAAITFRIYAYGTLSGSTTFSINDFTFNGVVSPIVTSTWGGSSWDNGTPDSSTTVIIDGDYDTGDDGNFSACSLTVNTGSTLTVSGSTYVEVENNIVVDGNILVRSQGAVVQNNDLATVTENGTITVQKETAPINNWYEYTNWSSPVSGETIGSALSDSQPGRRFLFNAQNYLDATKETNNDNSTVAGQDDVDDNGNDWQKVTDATVMTPGVGYISTHSKMLFESMMSWPPYRFTYEFSGPFNNGSISVPIYRNDSELNDNNWNLIGNPYPSAIDADLLLASNSSIDGAIYIWSHNSPLSATNNGNQYYNFSISDYAVINESSETAGGDAITPNRVVPSCQSFFISYSNSGTVVSTNGNVKEGTVTFTNSMRIKGTSDNSQFFKSANTKKQPKNTLKNKLWINLTSDNGVFSQISIGYVDGATKHDDGMRFDAAKVVVSKGSAVLFSTIKGSNKKFAIQGKNPKDLTPNEKIQLGFSTAIKVPTLYTLSIPKLQGAFLEDNTMYLKDKELKIIHNLTASGYTFTSDVGEFNNRFEIVFKSTDDLGKGNEHLVQISGMNRDVVTFSAAQEVTIKSILIYDFLGNLTYHLKGNSSLETYRLSKLKPNTIYVAKIELSGGMVVAKKIVKK